MGVGCATLFALPFLAIGLFGLGLALRFGLRGDWRSGGVAGVAIAGLVFTLAGTGVVAAALAGRRSLARSDERRQQYPGKPWMWRDDWASGRIQSTARPTLFQAWAVALLWNLCSTPLLVAILRGSVKSGPSMLIASTFPILGAALLLWAINTTLRYRKFGGSVFEMSQVPAALGGKLSGRIFARFERAPEAGVLLKLSNIRRTVRKSSDGDSVSDSIIWREEQTVRAAPGMDGWTIPIAFRIPADGVESSVETSRDGHLWRLSAEATVSETNFREQFDVPVFGKVAVASVATPDAAARVDFGSTTRPDPPSQPTIAVNRTATGGTVFTFAAARNPSASWSLTAIFALWSAVLAALVAFGAPIIVVILWGLFDLLIFAGFVGSWFSSSRLTIDANEAKSESALFGIGRLRRIPLADVVRIEMPITMQSNDTPYYAIRLILRDGRKITAGSGIRDKREAEWIIAEIRSLLRL